MTQDGLSRFDGKSFINYTKNSQLKHKIAGTDVRELIEDTAHNLIWVLPGEVGLNAISTITGEVKVTVPIPNTSHDDWNISMLKNGDEYWIGTSTGVKIYDSKQNRFLEVPQLLKKPNSLIDFAVRCIAKDKLGNIWVCYDRYGIVIYRFTDKKIIKEIMLAELNDHRKSNEIRFRNYLELHGEMFFATSQGLRKVSYSHNYNLKINNHPFQGHPLLNKVNIEYVAQNNDGDLIISGFGKLFRVQSSLDQYAVMEEAILMGETDWLNAVQCIYQDRENNLWLGCQEGLAFMPGQRGPFTRYNFDNSNNIRLDHVRTVCPLKNGDILAGLRSGLIHIDGKSKKYTKYDEGHLYHHIYVDKSGLIHTSRADGMYILNQGKLVPISKIYREFAPFSTIAINSHIFLNDSITLLGSENNNGLLVWNRRQKKVTKISQNMGPDFLSTDIVNNIYKDARQNIWVLSDNVITIFSENFKKRKELTFGTPNLRLFFDMCEANGSYWITSYGSGIVQLDSTFKITRVLSTFNGLSNDGVYQIYNLADKKLLVTTNNGLSLVDISTFKIRNFFEEAGLHSNAFEEVCGVAKDGMIYAGGVNGFTLIDPTKFRSNTNTPKLYFTNIDYQLKNKVGVENKIVDTFNLQLKHLTVPPQWLQLNIAFVGMNYSNPNRVVYIYRLKERDTTWINNGHNNQISLIGISPGRHTLEVAAGNEDGYWSTPKQLNIFIEPKWYQTWWFKLGLFITFCSILYAMYRYRVKQLEKQHLIRKNISTDLHDDIGSTLNTVKVFTHLAKRESNKNMYLDLIEISLTDAMVGLRDMLWVLDDTQETPNELIDRIKKFALPITAAKSINFATQITLEAGNRTLTKNEKRNLLLMAKEAINNSIKYANCKSIQVSFEESKDKKILMIKDDGIGFSINTTSDGNGLKNLHHRAQQIGYKVQIISSSNYGTAIKIEKERIVRFNI